MAQDKYTDIYNKVKEALEADRLYLRSDLSLAMLSRIVGTNTVYLSKAINQGFGQSFNTVVNSYRVNHIIGLSKQSSLRVEMIAAKFDFWSRSTFYDVFRQVTGMTPRRYMDMIKREKDESKEIRSLTH